MDFDVGPNKALYHDAMDLWNEEDEDLHLDNQQMDTQQELEQLWPPDTAVWHTVSLPDVIEPGADQDLGERPVLVHRAFTEAPQVRLGYLRAVKSNVYGHLTVQQATDSLNSTLDALFVGGALPVFPRSVFSLAEAKARLGLDPDLHITQYTLCPVCWKHFTPKQVEAHSSAVFPVANCSGILFRSLLKAYGACLCDLAGLSL